MRTATAVIALSTAAPVHAQSVPPELEGLLHIESPDAVVQIHGELESPEGDLATIEVIAPANTGVTFGDEPTGVASRPFLPPRLLDIEVDQPEGDMAAAVRYLSDGSAFYVLNRTSQNLVRFDAADPSAEPSALALPHLSVAFDLTPDGATAVVANLNDDSASLINLSSGASTTVAVGDLPGSVIVSPDGGYAVIGCGGDSSLHVINLGTSTVERVIASPGFASIFSFGSEAATVDYRFTTPLTFIDNTTLAFPARFDDLLAFINVATGTRTDLPLTRTDPNGIDVVGNTILLGHNTDPGYVTVIDATTRTELRTIQTPSRANGPLAMNANATRAAVALQNTTRVLDLTNDTFGPSLDTSNLNDIKPNFNRSRAVGIGFSGAVIDFASGLRLARANDRVSAALGTTSPTSDSAAMFSTTFGDDLVVIETDASPSLVYYGDSGPGTEGDISRNAAVTGDGALAASSNVFSDNLTIFDVQTRNPVSLGTLDERPGEVEFTPDGSKAVVCNLDGFVVSIVDTATGTTTLVPSARRLAQVEISPDGNSAYLAQIASGDGIRKLDLISNTFVGGLTPTGNLGGVGYSYSQVSQIALSPDGSLLAVASSFTDELFLVDTSTMLVTQSLNTGDFPTRIAWSDDGYLILVANRTDDSVSVFFDVTDTGVFGLLGTASVGDQPFDMTVAPDNQTAYVLNWSDSTVGRIDLNTLTQTTTATLPYRPMGISMSSDGTEIYVAGGSATTSTANTMFTQTREGELTVLDASTLAPVDAVNTGQPVASYASSDDGSTIVFASPNADGLGLVREDNCRADTNTDGILSPADFNGWIIQFNVNGPKCNQNDDGICTPADFNAWIINYNNGC